MEMPADGLLLDITIVIRNNNAQNVSEWSYSRYELNAGASIGRHRLLQLPTMRVDAFLRMARE